MKRRMLVMAMAIAILGMSCQPEEPTPMAYPLITDSGFLIATSKKALYDQVIHHIHREFEINEAFVITGARAWDGQDYVYTLVDFTMEGGEQSNVLLVIHRGEGSRQGMWTDTSKVTAVTCSKDMGCKMWVSQEETGKLIYGCPATQGCDGGQSVASL